jgi:hypothetical protein
VPGSASRPGSHLAQNELVELGAREEGDGEPPADGAALLLVRQREQDVVVLKLGRVLRHPLRHRDRCGAAWDAHGRELLRAKAHRARALRVHLRLLRLLRVVRRELLLVHGSTRSPLSNALVAARVGSHRRAGGGGERWPTDRTIAGCRC